MSLDIWLIIRTGRIAQTISRNRNGFFRWIQDNPRPLSELGHQLLKFSYQSLELYGNGVLVIPEYNVVAVRMLNQTERNPPPYDYIKDIQTFGNIVANVYRPNNLFQSHLIFTIIYLSILKKDFMMLSWIKSINDHMGHFKSLTMGGITVWGLVGRNLT